MPASPSVYRYTVPPEWDGALLQDYFQGNLGFSRRMVIDLKKGGMTVGAATGGWSTGSAPGRRLS